MKKKKIRVFSIFLVVIMLLGNVTVGAQLEESIEELVDEVKLEEEEIESQESLDEEDLEEGLVEEEKPEEEIEEEIEEEVLDKKEPARPEDKKEEDRSPRKMETRSLKKNEETEKETSLVFVEFVYDGKVIDTVEVEKGKTITPKDYSQLIEKNERIVGWLYGEKDFDFSQAIEEDIRLEAKVKKIFKVEIDSNGGSYLEDIYVLEGDNLLNKLENPSKPKEEFSHWSKTKDGTAYNLKDSVTGPFTLYAVWKTREVASYKVIYKLENAEDENYSVFKIDFKEGKIGEPTNPDPLTEEEVPDLDGFKLSDKNKQVIIKADGTSEVEVLYDRKIYQAKFVSLADPLEWFPFAEGKLKYGQSTQKLWEEANKKQLGNKGWRDKKTLIFYKEPPTMENKDMTFVPSLLIGFDSNLTVSYREKSESGLEGGIFPFEMYGTRWNDKKAYEVRDNIEGYSFEKALGGREGNAGKREEKTRDDLKDGKLDMYGYSKDNKKYTIDIVYSRNQYKLVLENPILSKNYYEGDVYYEKPFKDLDLIQLEEGKEMTWVDLDGVTRTYKFIGWFTNKKLLGEKQDLLSMTMPAKNLTLYAGWEEINSLDKDKIKVRIHKNKNIDSPYLEYKILKGQVLEKDWLDDYEIPAGLSKEDFKGWYQIVDGEYQKVDIEKGFSKDKDLYPVFNKYFKLSYEDPLNDKPEDKNEYAHGSYAKTADHTNKTDRNFIGWFEEGSDIQGSTRKIYPSRTKIYMDGDKKLIALYEDEDIKETSLTYNPGVYQSEGPDLDPAYYTIEGNDPSHELLDPEDLNYRLAGYKFLAWEYKGELYKPKDKINLDISKENVVTAIWKEDVIDLDIEIVWPEEAIRSDIRASLYRDGSAYKEDFIILKTSDSHRLIKLPKQDANNKDYDYEIQVENDKNLELYKDYRVETSEVEKNKTYRIEIKKKKEETRDIRVEKEWIGGPRPNVGFSLYVNDKLYAKENLETGKTSLVFKDVPVRNKDGILNKLDLKEDKLDKYESSISYDASKYSFYVKNLYVKDLNDYKIIGINWLDDYSLRPDKVKVDVYRQVDKKGRLSERDLVETVTLTGRGSRWVKVLTDLVSHDGDGNPYVYSIEEEKLDNFTSSHKDFEVYYSPVDFSEDKIDYRLDLAWKKGSGPRPDVWVFLYKDGVAYGEAQVLEDGVFSYLWRGLDKFDRSGREIVYRADLIEVPKDYKKEVYHDEENYRTSLVLTYEKDSGLDEKIDLDLVKIWQGGRDHRPDSIRVYLYRNDKVLYKLSMSGQGDKWTTTIEDLDKYDKDMNPYSYRIKEEEVPGFESTLEGFTMTNTFVSKKDQILAINWLDDYSLRPDKVKVDIYRQVDRNGSLSEKDLVETVSLTGKGARWTKVLSELASHDPEGNPYIYTIEEEKLDNFTSSHEDFEVYYSPVKPSEDKIDYRLDLAWKKGTSPRPDILVQLYKDGLAYGKAQILKDGELSYLWKGLDKYDKSGRELVYKVDLLELPSGYKKEVYHDDKNHRTRITLSYQEITSNSKDQDIVISWQGGESFRPESVKVKVYQNDRLYKNLEVKGQGDRWEYRLENLPLKDDRGRAYNYRIEQEELKDFSSQVKGFEIVNTYRPKGLVGDGEKGPGSGGLHQVDLGANPITGDRGIWIYGLIILGSILIFLLAKRSKEEEEEKIS